jgi:hypothetical protein
MKPLIVGITGYKGSGKTTVANEFLNIGFASFNFSRRLKSMLANLGVPHDNLYGNDDKKNEPLDILGGVTTRRAMQTLGTEWGRDLIYPDLWVDLWKGDVRNQGFVVMDDLRFPNEQKAIRDLGGYVFMVKRRKDETSQDTHRSEDLSHIQPDYIFYNTTTMDTIRTMAQSMAQNIRDHGWRPAA